MGAGLASLNPVSSVENVARGTQLSLTNQPLCALGSLQFGSFVSFHYLLHQGFISDPSQGAPCSVSCHGKS